MIRLALVLASALGVVWLASGVDPQEISARAVLVRERLAPLGPLARDLLAPPHSSESRVDSRESGEAAWSAPAPSPAEPLQARASSPEPPPPKPRPPRSIPAQQSEEPAPVEPAVAEPAVAEPAPVDDGSPPTRTAGLSREAARQVRGRLDRVMGLANGRDW